MSKPEDLLRILEEAKQEVDRWEDWMKNQEPEPGSTSRRWLLNERDEEDTRLTCGTSD